MNFRYRFALNGIGRSEYDVLRGVSSDEYVCFASAAWVCIADVGVSQSALVNCSALVNFGAGRT